MYFLREFYAFIRVRKKYWAFIRVRKKYWLLPVIILALVLGGLLALSQVSAVAPMIYPIF